MLRTGVSTTRQHHFWFLNWLTLLLFVVVSVFGILSFSLTMDSAMMMSDCPLMGAKAAICPMQIFDHIAIWQRLFTAIPAAEVMLLLLLTVSFLLATNNHRLATDGATQIFSRYRADQKSHPNIRLYNYLLSLFANGLLQPKLFA